MNTQEYIKYTLINEQDFNVDLILEYYEPSELVYYSECDQVINDYDAEFGDEADDMCCGKEYMASEYQQAKFDYANALYYCAQQADLDIQCDITDKELDTFNDAVREYFDEHYPLFEPDSLTVEFSNNCSYGWEAHNYESEDGIMFWEHNNKDGYNPRLLEGECIAIAMQLTCGAWVSVCITEKAILEVLES